MLFQDAYITDEGSVLLSRGTAGIGSIVWGQAATSSLDTDLNTDDEMRAITTETFGTLTSLGSVVNATYNSQEEVVSFQCKLENRLYDGDACTFGVWGKIEGDASEVLVIVARCGRGVIPTTIDDISNGLERAYVDIAVSLSDHQSNYLAVNEDYYASSSALNNINEMVTDISLHSPKQYQDLWEALVLSTEGERFSYLNPNVPLEISEIDNEAFEYDEINVSWIQDGLVFFWYVQGRDWENPYPQHVVIASLDDLRKGIRTSLLNRTDLFTGYPESSIYGPCYIDDDIILFPDSYEYQGGYYHYISRESYGYLGLYGFDGVLPGNIPNGYMLSKILLTRAGNVAIFGDPNALNDYTTYYVFGVKFKRTGNPGYEVLTIDSYDKIVSYNDQEYPRMFNKFGKIGNSYWGCEDFVYLSDGSDVFHILKDTDGNEINTINGCTPAHYNALLLMGDYSAGGYQSDVALYSLIDCNLFHIKNLYNATSGIKRDFGDCQGLLAYDGYTADAFVFTPYGVVPFKGRDHSNIGDPIPLIPMYIFKTTTSYQSNNQTLYKLVLTPGEGDFSKCIRENGMIFPLL